MGHLRLTFKQCWGYRNELVKISDSGNYNLPGDGGGEANFNSDSSIIFMRLCLGPIIWDGDDWFDGTTN